MLLSILAGICITALFGGAGVFMLFKYFQENKNSEESQNWSSTQGMITKSSLRQEVSYESSNTLYYPEVEYAYESLGTEYTGDRITFGGSTGYSQRNKTEEVLAKYPIGANVTVYYDPHAPEKAVLERKMGTGGNLFLILGILFLLVSLCTVCFGGIFTFISFAGY